MLYLSAEAQAVSENSISVFNMILKGGWLMLPIFILSIVSIYIYVERYAILRKLTRKNMTFMSNLQQHLRANNIQAAIAECSKESSPSGRILLKGIQHLDLPTNELRSHLESNANIEIGELEKGLSTLSTSSGLAPMIGFLGTVVGMVQAFYDMSLAGSNINITLLSRGIYTAMITTVAGLFVGIIAYLAYNTLTAKINKIATTLESTNADFLEMIYESKKK